MNMKLTNLSLSVLVALGLVACGGSDNNDNAATDPSAGQVPPPPAPQPQPNPQPSQPTDGKTVVKKPTNDPITGTEGRFHNDVRVSFDTYANRKGLDILGGYWANPLDGDLDPNSPNYTKKPGDADFEHMVYESGATSWEDIKRASSIVNYMQAGWVNASSANTDDLKPESNVLRLNPLQTYAKVPGGYLRIYTPVLADGKTIQTWDKATAVDKFLDVHGDTHLASELYYIPNIMTAAKGARIDTYDNGARNDNDAVLPSNLGSYNLNPEAAKRPGVNFTDLKTAYYDRPDYAKDQFDIHRQDVNYDFVRVGADDKGQGGNTYWINRINGANNGYKIDLGEIPLAKLTTKNIDLGYTVRDNKGTNDGRDDDVLNKVTGSGELRIYDVNYSRATLEVNQAARENSDDINANPRNGLGFNGRMVRNTPILGYGTVVGEGHDGAYGPFQVKGSQNGTIPLNGRAHYLGKSFGVNSIGDIDLEADFGIDRATVHGIVENRHTYGKQGAGNAPLPDMLLSTIFLSQPGQYRRDASVGLDSTSPVENGTVSVGDQQNWGTWAVRFYGPNAASAAGVIAYGFQPNGGAAETNALWSNGPSGNGEGIGSGNVANPVTGKVGLNINDGKLNNVVEVFNAERGELLPKSLNNPYDFNK